MKKGFIAEGTVCTSCEKIVKEQANKIKGVTNITFDYTSQTGYVTFDEKKTSIDTILSKIEEKGYNCFILKEGSSTNSSNPIGWIAGIIGIIVIGYFLLNLVEGFNIPQISQNMGYGLLFLVGILTGFHCVGMCGGFIVSYTAHNSQRGKKSHMSHLLYGTSKLISYTIIGAMFGLFGSIIAFTPQMRGVAGVLAGLFLLLFGLKMLNIFPILRKLTFRTPFLVTKLTHGRDKSSNPTMIGLLNGLMIACGPLQAIYIMAAGTGSMIEGAKLLFVFGLGTMPVMLGFGFFAGYVSSKMTQKILKISGAVVMLLGLIMINNGLVLTGSGYDVQTVTEKIGLASGLSNQGLTSKTYLEMNEGFQEIKMDVTRSGWIPDKFVLQKDVPVKWIINGMEITGCNNAIQVPKYGLKFDIKPGEQVIEFTPDETGTIRWSCWMGMIPGTFIVVDDIDLNDADAVKKEIESVPVQTGGTCGGSCSGSTCGAKTDGSCGCSN